MLDHYTKPPRMKQVSETGVEPALPRLKVWCPSPLDDSDIVTGVRFERTSSWFKAKSPTVRRSRNVARAKEVNLPALLRALFTLVLETKDSNLD